MKFASIGGAGSGNACFYFEVRRASTGAVLGTYGSSASPVACSAGATQGVSTTDISAQVTNTTIANDLRIRVFGVETGAKAWRIDSGTVTGSAAGEKVSVAIQVSDADGLLLAASFVGLAEPLTTGALARVLLRHPLLMLEVLGGIHWEALKMALKGLRFASAR